MILTLDRWASTPLFGTFGTLTVGDWKCYSVEKPWKDNQPSHSCVPVGTYALALSTYHKGGYPAYELTHVPGRARILIHRANRATELEGCIAPGTGLGMLGGDWAVLNSGVAFDQIMTKLQAGSHEIQIRWTIP